MVLTLLVFKLNKVCSLVERREMVIPKDKVLVHLKSLQ
jgi:hypothetical protein